MGALEYREDFPEPAAAEFDRLLSLADETFVARPVEHSPPHSGRGFCYRQAAICVVRHCDVLLAVWDGTERDTCDGAGTWETVKLARELGTAIHHIAV
jgi:hypothetical protein